jgi:4-amino-4-deoxy-L-arabinose transferase-like glycosyltransferase/DNA-binding beta-propeller fold protein YncE
MGLGAIRNRWWFLALFLFALAVRLFRLDWDQHHFFHPDERAIGFAIDRLSFSPPQLNPHFFAYGSLPLYVIKCVTALLGNFRASLRGYDASIFAGRALSAVWGAATAVLLAMLGTRLYGRRVGLFAGFLLAASVLHVQNSHFATSDIPLAFWILLCLNFLVRVAESGNLRHYVAAGLSAGLAIATKFSALPLLLPIGIAVIDRCRVEGKRLRPLLFGACAGLALAAAFFIGQPYAILDFHAFRNDILEQSRMVRHAGLYPYTNQYVGVPKYLYDLEQMVLWGMGPALGLAVLAGTIACCFRTVRRPRVAEVLLLAWVLPFFAITGSFDVKFPRYLLPIYPLLVLWGAVWLEEWAARSRIGRVARGLVLAATFLWLAAFMRIYTRPHSEVTASEWFYRQIPAGVKIASQDWDEGFPFPLPGERNPERYRIVTLSYYEPDTPEKIRRISGELASSEYAVFQTKRIYGAVSRAPKKFPLTVRYFERLFAGDLGYTLTRDFASRPALLGIEVPDELADESFSVYDHPKILVFRNTAHLPAGMIEDRVLRGSPSRALTRRDLLLARADRFASARAPGVAASEEAPAPAAAPPRPSPAGPLDQPRGIALDGNGRGYVCDFGHDRMQEFDADLKPVSAWGRKGDGPGEFRQPGDVSVGADGRVYVADTWNSRVQVFDAAGKFLAEWRNDFFGPRGIATGPRGQVFVADTGNHRIVRFSAEGVKESEWGGRGAEPGKLFEPVGIAVNSQGRVFVCDNGNGRMQVFESDGRFVRSFEVAGWRSEVFSEPHVALDSKGTPWLTVPLEGEIRHYSTDGRLLKRVTSHGPGGEKLDHPMGVAMIPGGQQAVISDLSGRLWHLSVSAAR